MLCGAKKRSGDLNGGCTPYINTTHLNFYSGIYVTTQYAQKCVPGFTTRKGTHGVTAMTIGWRLPAQGSIPGCRTNLWSGAHLPVMVVVASLWVTPSPSRFWWGHFLKYNAC
jgi:hypothetical protein